MTGHLSPRQTEVARLVVLGYSNKAIAAELHLSVYSVQEYLARMSRRIEGVGKPRMKVFRWWYSQGHAA